ncbi:orotidine-5'-phosphate decarboxylase [Hyphobacterium sp. WM6]
MIVALDVPRLADAEALAARLDGAVSWFKLGLQLFPLGAMDLSARLRAKGKKTFLDWKLHDIPKTVERATRSIADAGGDMLTIHAEPDIMSAAVQGKAGDPDLNLMAVTVLTAYDDAMLTEMGYAYTARDLVFRRVEQALEAGMDGIIASPLEAVEIRKRFGRGFLLATPGVRPAGADAGDQKRVATPGEAMRMGADYVVVGRPVAEAPDPVAAANAINAEIAEALGN